MRVSKQKASEAAQALAQRSVKARKEKWGEDEFQRRMQEWGKLGGRPKSNSPKSRADRKQKGGQEHGAVQVSR